MLLAALALAGAGLPVVVRATYRCDDGIVRHARFDNLAGTLRLTASRRRPALLKQARAASGIRYAGDGLELRAKGRDATLTRRDGRLTRCRETRQQAG